MNQLPLVKGREDTDDKIKRNAARETQVEPS